LSDLLHGSQAHGNRRWTEVRAEGHRVVLRRVAAEGKVLFGRNECPYGNRTDVASLEARDQAGSDGGDDAVKGRRSVTRTQNAATASV
jgi:hypothetical protein